jgi:hopanoid biosynthesis associated RND transporter like protein HpnN
MSELGLISGTSMFIGLLTSLTVLPAMMTVLPFRPAQRWTTLWSARDLYPIYEFPLRHGQAIRGTTLLLLLLSLFLLTKATFDRNPHNLRDPHSESVSTLKDLLESGEGAPWTVSVLAPDTGGASDYAARLHQLDTVKDVRTINDFVPEHQVGKLMLLQEMAETFLSRPGGPSAQSPAAKPEDPIPALRAFLNRLDEFVQSGKRTNEADPAVRLRVMLSTLLTQLDSFEGQPKSRLLERLHQSLLGSLPAKSMNTDPTHHPGPFSVDDLPREVYERWVSEDGSYRIEVTPKEDLRSTIAMRNFVNDVRVIAPQATGLPVSYLDGSQQVIQAFGQAFVFAILAIIGILAIVFRNLRDALLVILPLCLAGVLTGAMTVALDTPFNYANILVLPLIFGLGADCGIHIVERMRRMPARCGDFLRSSTMRGVFFSGLTTILSFSNLAYTPHLGVSSMGRLLAMGVLFTLVATLVVLPAILYPSRRQVAGD